MRQYLMYSLNVCMNNIPYELHVSEYNLFFKLIQGKNRIASVKFCKMKPIKTVDKELLLIQEWYTNFLKYKYKTILLTLITVYLFGLNVTLI